MANAAQQMPEHVGTAYKDAVDNINLSEKAAVAGDQLRPTCICGHFRNVSSLL